MGRDSILLISDAYISMPETEGMTRDQQAIPRNYIKDRSSALPVLYTRPNGRWPTS